MVVKQHEPASARTSARPQVVVFDPVSWELADWSYEIERAALAARGVDLVVPEDAASSDAAIVDADVVIVTAIRDQLNAAAIGTLKNAVGLVCSSIGMNQVDHEAARRAAIPVANVPSAWTKCRITR